MKITREVPAANTKRTRRVFAFLPENFAHGTQDNPLITTVWLDYYLVEEVYHYGKWKWVGKRLEELKNEQNIQRQL
jgi:hypothetical protein